MRKVIKIPGKKKNREKKMSKDENDQFRGNHCLRIFSNINGLIGSNGSSSKPQRIL